MERSSQTNEMRIDDIWIFISLCTHNDMTTPLPRCSMLVCMCSRRLCGIYVVRIPSRSVSSLYANIECEGERGFFTGIAACRPAWMPFANCFPSTVPLNMVMHCTVVWMRDRDGCPYNTRPRVSRTYTLGKTFVEVPLNRVMHCTVVWTRDRYVCPYNTRPRVSGCVLSSPFTFSYSSIHSSHAAAVQPKGRRIIAKPLPPKK